MHDDNHHPKHEYMNNPYAASDKRSPLGRARGHGSAKEGPEHWWQQRVTAVALVPLVLWFVISVIAHVGDNYLSMKGWLSRPGTATMLVLLLAAVFHHAQLGLQVVIEDYVHAPLTRTVSIIAIKILAVALFIYGAISVVFIAVGAS